METQQFIVNILIIAAIAYSIYGIVKLFLKKQNKSCNCSSCDLKANIKELKTSIHKKEIHTN